VNCGRLVRLDRSTTLRGWLDANWVGFLGYHHIFHTLDRGWIVFKFISKEDLGEIFITGGFLV
jgi:hypothetical protein